MTKQIKSITHFYKALEHLRRKHKFVLVENCILHKVGKQRVFGLVIYVKQDASYHSPIQAVYNFLCRKSHDPQIMFDRDALSLLTCLPEEDAIEIRQASADSPYADPDVRIALLSACGLKEVPHTKRKPVTRKQVYGLRKH